MRGFLHNIEESILHNELCYIFELIIKEKIFIVRVIFLLLWLLLGVGHFEAEPSRCLV